MLKAKFRYILNFIFLLFAFGCDYQFSKDYYVNIEQFDPNPSLVVEPFVDGMTLSRPTTFTFSYNGNNVHRLYNINVTIDNNGILGTNNATGSFEINTYLLSEGEHSLTLTYQLSSGTGSLADVNNREIYDEKLEYTFIVDKSSPSQAILTQVSVIDGTIFIDWESIITDNFNEALLRINDPESGRILRDIPLSLDTIYASSFNDQFSTELDLEFSIILKNWYAESISNSIRLTLTKPNFKGQIISNTSYRILWDEHPLYGNFEHYSYNVRPNNTFVELSNRGGEYLVNDSPLFAQPDVHQLNLVRDNSNLFYISGEMHFGEQFEAKTGISYVYSNRTNSIYAVVLDGTSSFNAPREVIIYELNKDDLSIKKSKTLFTINDSYAKLVIDPTTQNLILDLEDSSYLLDINTLSILNSWEAKDYLADTNFITVAYRNGFFIIAKSGGDFLSIYDAETKALLYTDSVEYKYFISDDGMAFINNNVLYTWQGGSFNNVLQIEKVGNVSVHEAIFIPGQTKCIYSNINSSPIIFDYQTNSSSTISDLSGIYKMQYDNGTNKVCLISKTGNFKVEIAYLFDFVAGTEKSLQLHYQGDYFYLNKKLINNKGLYLNDYFY